MPAVNADTLVTCAVPSAVLNAATMAPGMFEPVQLPGTAMPSATTVCQIRLIKPSTVATCSAVPVPQLSVTFCAPTESYPSTKGFVGSPFTNVMKSLDPIAGLDDAP